MMSFMISVVPPKMDRTLKILGTSPDHYGQGDRSANRMLKALASPAVWLRAP